MRPEPLHVMARGESGIDSVVPMKGKRVNIGNPGSGTPVLVDVLMEHARVSSAGFVLTAELKSSKRASDFCDDKFDTAVWAVGLTNGMTMEATSTCDIKLLGLTTSGTARFSRATLLALLL